MMTTSVPIHEAEGTPANPLQCPLSLSLNSWDGVNGMEQVVLLLGILDVGLEKKAVHLCGKIFDQNGHCAYDIHPRAKSWRRLKVHRSNNTAAKG